ncbi:MAG: cobyric acid synthase [Proteobacteria bacterium]|nr:cobyric acid synthase [Pseudomonadota bacterium]
MPEVAPSLAPVLCIFGTGSDVGKSWLTAGLCRLFANAGVRVAPYKAQNMSNNAGVTPLGLEMGRAQIVQAQACRLVPHVDMNPLLLKPNTDTGAQVVALGKVIGTMEAREYFSGGMDSRRGLVNDALDRLRAQAELVIAEGAGSCAEVNLRDRDLVNFPIAHHANAAVLLVADIHKGGVFGQLVGTLEVMPAEDRARVKGLIVNRFRGDQSLFDDGVRWLEERTGLPVLGVIPWLREATIESEDGLAPDTVIDPPAPQNRDRFHAAVLRLPHIANFTDFDALERHGVQVHYLAEPRDLSAYDLVILPGTKNTRGDLDWLRRIGWEPRLANYDGAILGICGGFQMLGERILDPRGAEGEPGESAGLGRLPVRTTLAATKTTRQVTGTLGDLPIGGYEIHLGETTVDCPPLLHLDDDARDEGARLGNILGTYLHGLFDHPGAVKALLGPIRPDLAWPELGSHEDWRQEQFDILAEHLRAHLDTERLGALTGHAL